MEKQQNKAKHIYHKQIFSPSRVGGRAILRYSMKCLFQSSQQCYQPLFLYKTDIWLRSGGVSVSFKILDEAFMR